MDDAVKITNPILLKEDEEFDDDSHQALMSWCEETLEKFLESYFCAKWNDNTQGIACFFIQGFVDYAYGYHLAKPFQYDRYIVEEVCLDIFPRKMSTDTKYFKQVALVLITFFEWCEKEGLIKDTKDLRSTLKKIDQKIYKSAKILPIGA